MLFRVLLTLYCFVCLGQLQGQGQMMIQTRAPGFDTSALQVYADDPDYEYGRKAPKTSWLERLWERIKSLLDRAFSGPDNMWRRVLFYTLMIAGILLLIYFLIKARYHSIFGRRDRRIAEIRILDTDVRTDRIPGLIDEALQQGDYRLAFRWTYISLLKNLGDRGLLHLHRNKTNRDYIADLKDRQIRDDFSRLAHAFEYVWYGEYSITAEAFQSYRDQAASLTEKTLVS